MAAAAARSTLRRAPADIWEDSNAVQEYVGATIAYYKLEGATLKQKSCDRVGRRQKGSLIVPWTTPKLMSTICTTGCGCTYPNCRDVPDQPRVHSYCSLCGPKFNADIKVKFWVSTLPPGPAPPSPPPAGCRRGACPFSYTNPTNVNGGRCGEVDASSRLPRDIWGYQGAIDKYVDATLRYYSIGDNGGPEGGVLVNAPCDHATRVRLLVPQMGCHSHHSTALSGPGLAAVTGNWVRVFTCLAHYYID